MKNKVVEMKIEDLGPNISSALSDGRRLGMLTARGRSIGNGSLTLISLIMDTRNAGWEIWETDLPDNAKTVKSMTIRSPQVHRFERRIGDMFGLAFEGHPRPKSDVLHEYWPEGFYPLAPGAPDPDNFEDAKRKRYDFQKVTGDDVYEIPVGPIHAGIIEPGHFRFSCLGEVIQNLEIRLGYQHRGIERRLSEIDWRKARFLAETISSDTCVGNACAHALAIENLLGVAAPPLAAKCRAMAMEIERIASHIGDFGGICADIGFSGGNALFSRLRGQTLGLGEMLTGARFMTSYVLPGGVKRAPPQQICERLTKEIETLEQNIVGAIPALLDNSGALARMENVGRVRQSTARDFGLVGPAGRASGIDYDVRRDFRQEPYSELNWNSAKGEGGDVYSRVKIRADEIRASLAILRDLAGIVKELNADRENLVLELPESLPSQQYGVGIVESWRGELIHLVYTSENGISRYAIKDPSFNNWTGLAIAVRGQLVADFPLCNKSFNLSYSGNDL